jgi:putative toxin-antitoxin system antitoxin component (TIGR02293 family)
MNTLDATLRYLKLPPRAGLHGLDAAVVGTLAHKLSVDEPVVLKLARIGARTYQRRRSDGAPLTETESDRLLRVARIAQEAERVFGDAAKARGWLGKPSAALGGAAPLELLGSDAGARDVEAELTRIEWGDFA